VDEAEVVGNVIKMKQTMVVKIFLKVSQTIEESGNCRTEMAGRCRE
jgi:hypothetical protein